MTIQVRVSFTDDAGTEETLTSAATEAVQPVPNNPATGAPSITGTAQVGETLSADTSAIADADGLANVSYSYQWIRNDGGTDSNISGATYSSHTLAADDEGRTIKVQVSFTDDTGSGETLTSAATAAVVARPNNPATGAPSITGTAQVGETLSADTSAIADADGLANVSYSYQWIRNDGGADSNISGATHSSYTLAADDEGRTIKVQVSFTDDTGSGETLTSAATAAVVARPNNPATGAPSITGTAQVGETLSADTSAIADADGLANVSYSYQWIRNDGGTDSNISGATHSSHTLAADDEGRTIKVQVSFTDDAGNAETLSSVATSPVEAASPPPNRSATGLPSIVGSARVESTLTVDTSGIADADGMQDVVFRYQWIAGESGISGASQRSYTLTSDEEGLTIRVSVSFSDDAGNAETLSSVATSPVESASPPPNRSATGLPSIVGSARVGSTLTVDTSGIADADGMQDVVFRYQWIAGESGISGASQKSYTLTSDEEGLTIRVSVSFSDDAGNAETLSSVATSPVESASPPPNRSATGLPSIVGSARVESTLTVDTSGIADADGMQDVVFRYQWIVHDGRSHTAIDGARGSSYTLVESDEGQRIRILVIFTDDEGNTETLVSAPTATVAE